MADHSSNQSKMFKTCRWKTCGKPITEGSFFCEAHSTTPEGNNFPKWIRELPVAIGTGLATSLLYDLLKYFMEQTMFFDTTAKRVESMMMRLKIEELADTVVPEVAAFIEATRDPGFATDMEKIMRGQIKPTASASEG